MKPLTRKQVVIHFIDEISILVMLFIGILFSDIVINRSRGMTLNNIHFSGIQLFISAIIAVLVYGKFYTDIMPHSNRKEPWLKRATTGFAQGILWRDLVSIGD